MFRSSVPADPSQLIACPAAISVSAFDHWPPLITVPVGPETARSWDLIDAPSTAPAFWAANAIMYTASYAWDA